MAQPNNYLHIILKICLCIKEKKVQVTTKKLKNEKIKCENYVHLYLSTAYICQRWQTM